MRGRMPRRKENSPLLSPHEVGGKKKQYNNVRLGCNVPGAFFVIQLALAGL